MSDDRQTNYTAFYFSSAYHFQKEMQIKTKQNKKLIQMHDKHLHIYKPRSTTSDVFKFNKNHKLKIWLLFVCHHVRTFFFIHLLLLLLLFCFVSLSFSLSVALALPVSFNRSLTPQRSHSIILSYSFKHVKRKRYKIKHTKKKRLNQISAGLLQMDAQQHNVLSFC